MKIQKLKVANIQSYCHHDDVIHADNTVRKEVAKAGNTVYSTQEMIVRLII